MMRSPFFLLRIVDFGRHLFTSLSNKKKRGGGFSTCVRPTVDSSPCLLAGPVVFVSSKLEQNYRIITRSQDHKHNEKTRSVAAKRGERRSALRAPELSNCLTVPPGHFIQLGVYFVQKIIICCPSVFPPYLFSPVIKNKLQLDKMMPGRHRPFNTMALSLLNV